MRTTLFKLLDVFFLILISQAVYSQGSNIEKQGGVCFRTDDNHPITEYLEYATVFDKYNKNFTFALNLDITNIDANYIAGVKQLQNSGHEMMDHTPYHKIPYFYTLLSPDYFINHPGVQEVDGTKVKLKHANVNISDAKRSGFVNTNGNIITSPDGIFANFSKYDCYLYFPSLDKLVYISDYSNHWIDDNNVKITDVWNYSVDLGSHTNIKFYNFDNKNVHLTIDAIKAIAEESIRLADHFGFQKPATWIQPGGYHPYLRRDELKNALLTLGYKQAGNFVSPSLKVFNEYNPNNDKQFGMSWGDFYEDTWSLEKTKTAIADRVAKHHVTTGHSHFSGLLDGWNGFLERTENIVKWCAEKDIPIRTYNEWADILYNKTPDPYQNIFPKLSVDKDNNGYPDGYFKKSKIYDQVWINYDGQWGKNDGIPESDFHSFSINKVGDICYVGRQRYYEYDGLGGLEKGENDFSIWTKGAAGNFIEVDFKIGSNHSVFKFPAESSEWSRYNINQSINGNNSLVIPQNISIIDVTIRCSDYSSGTVKISGMELRKKDGNQNNSPVITSSPITKAIVGDLYSYDVNAYGAPTPKYTLTVKPNGMTINEDSGLITWTPTQKGSYNVTVNANNSVEPNASQTFTIIVTPNVSLDAPSNLNISNIKYNSAEINWQDNSADETNFIIYRKLGNNDWIEIHRTNENTESYLDNSLTSNTNYCYLIKAYNSVENVSSSISETKCITTTTLVLTTPTDFISTEVTKSKISLEWSDQTSDETNFEIERKKVNEEWIILATLPKNAESYIDSNLATNTEYCYRVRAYNNIENIYSNYTSITCVTTLENYVISPSELECTDFNLKQIKISWIDNSDNETNFSVERKNEENKWSVLSILGANTNEFIDSLFISNTEYCYRVCALDTTNTISSEYSNLMCINTLPLNCTISCNIFPENSGIISGEDTFEEGDSVNLVATPNSGFKFKNWTENDTIISIDSILTFTIYKSRNISANFDIITSINSFTSLSEIPTEFSLSECFPNPFNPTTTIQFTLPESSIVNLQVIDTQGKIIKTIANQEIFGAGIYSYSFNAERLSSGIYFYRLTAGNFVQTKKMILLK